MFNEKLSTILAAKWTLAEKILDDILYMGFAIRHDAFFSTIDAVISSLDIPPIFAKLLCFEIEASWLQRKSKVYDVNGIVFYGVHNCEYLPIFNSKGDVVKLFASG